MQDWISQHASGNPPTGRGYTATTECTMCACVEPHTNAVLVVCYLHRYPDVAVFGHQFEIVQNKQSTIVDGTSASTPSFAGMVRDMMHTPIYKAGTSSSSLGEAGDSVERLPPLSRQASAWFLGNITTLLCVSATHATATHQQRWVFFISQNMKLYAATPQSSHFNGMYRLYAASPYVTTPLTRTTLVGFLLTCRHYCWQQLLRRPVSH